MAHSGARRLNVFYFLLFIGAFVGLTTTMEISQDYLWDDPSLRTDYRKPLTCDDMVLQKICYKSCGKYYKCEDNRCKCIALESNQNEGPTAAVENIHDFLRSDSNVAIIDSLKEYQIPLTCDGKDLHTICYNKCGKYYTCEDDTCKCSDLGHNLNEGIATVLEKLQDVLKGDSNVVGAVNSQKEYRIPLTCDDKTLQQICYESCGKYYTCEGSTCKCTEHESNQNKGPTAAIEYFLDFLKGDSTIAAVDNMNEYEIPLTCDGMVLHKICFKKCGKYYTCVDNTCTCSELEKNLNEELATAIEKFQDVLKGDSRVTAVNSLNEYQIPLTCDEMVCFKKCGNYYTCENNICKCTQLEQQKISNKDIMVNVLRDIEELIKLYDNSVYIDFTQAKDLYPMTSKKSEKLEDLEDTEAEGQTPQKSNLRHHIAHFCENLEEARKCIKKCMKVGKPAFCGKDHVCYCGHRYTSHDENKPINLNDTYAEFSDLYEKYFGPRSNEQELH